MRDNNLHSALALALFLASCQGNGSAFQPTSEVLSGSSTQSEARFGSSSQVTYSNQDLLYITTNADSAYVLSYPDGNVLGALSLGAAVRNICTDSSGNIYFVVGSAFPGAKILKYAHAGNQPIATYADDAGNPTSCSVDNVTGDLAVTNLDDGKGGSGSVLIYQNPNQNPQIYTDPSVPNVVSGAYDDEGNLLIDGLSGFAMLPKNGATLEPISFRHPPAKPGIIAWDGSYFAIGGRSAPGERRGNTVSRATIEGSTGTIVEKVKLTGKKVEFGFVDGSVVIAAFGTKLRQLGYWSYPAGGRPTKTISGIAGKTSLGYAAVSLASTPSRMFRVGH
jgi:hypothetical protein